MSKTLNPKSIRALIKQALREDLGDAGDVTTLAVIPPKASSRGRIVAREDGVFCGRQILSETFKILDRKAKGHFFSQDGQWVKKGKVVAEIHAKTRALLSGERTALNFIQHLSGISTLTRQYVEKVKKVRKKSRLKILDTRKTTPLLRELEKYAVSCGGGTNHRFGLYDMVLIKDNHLAAVAKNSKYPIRDAVRIARKKWPKLRVEVECDTLFQVEEAIQSCADRILLDNMSISQLKKSVKKVAGRIETEASGGIHLKTIQAVAAAGVDFVSVGALTHSAKAMDFSLDIPPPK